MDKGQQAENGNTKRSDGALEFIIGSWGNIAKSLLFFACIVVISAVVGVQSYNYIMKNSGVDVEFTSSGGIIFHSRNNIKSATIMVPASQGWMDTKFVLKPNETIKFNASGRVHLAISHLIDFSRKEEKPDIGWVGPNGSAYQPDAENDEEELRRMLLVDPDAPIGKLLALLRKPDEPSPGIENARPGEIFKVGEDGTVTNDSKEDATLWLTVNDMYLNDTKDAQEAYIGSVKDEKKQKERLEAWQRIKKQKYWNLWFEDNIGQFLVKITFITMIP